MSEYALRSDDIEPLLEGLSILGTGGGGSPRWGRALLENELSRGRRPRLMDLQDVADDASVVCGEIVATDRALEERGISTVLGRWEENFELEKATRVMEGILGKSIQYVVPFGLGGLMAPAVLALGARLDIPVIDGDGLGRSAPETQMTSFIGHGISLTPMPLVDHEGNVVVVGQAGDITYPGRIGKWLVSHGGGLGAFNHYPMSGRQAKKALIPGTIRRALSLGAAVQNARHERRDPLSAVHEHLDGRPLFRGVVLSMEELEGDGYPLSQATIRGTHGDGGKTAHLTLKNETMMLEVEGRPYAMFPDLVIMLEPASGQAVLSVDLRPGIDLTLIGSPCHPRLREAALSPVGQTAFGPQRYGRPDLRYRPIEELLPEA